MNTELPDIRLVQNGNVRRIDQALKAAQIRMNEKWQSVRFFDAGTESLYEIYSIVHFPGDCKTHIIITDDAWSEILSYTDFSSDEEIAESKLLLFDEDGEICHELFPIGKHGDEIYLAIDDINNVDFEFDFDDDDDSDDDDSDFKECQKIAFDLLKDDNSVAVFEDEVAGWQDENSNNQSGLNTDLRKIALGNHSFEQWKEIFLTVNCDSDDEEMISITSIFRGDLKTYCVLTAAEWQEILQYMEDYDAAPENCKLEIKDGGWGDSHALIPIGQRNGDVYLAIDSTDNVEFEFED